MPKNYPSHNVASRLVTKPIKKPRAALCGVQFQTMLSCWAASGDIRNSAACKEAAQSLIMCLKTSPIPGPPKKSPINYHLSNLAKLKSRTGTLPGSYHIGEIGRKLEPAANPHQKDK